MKLQTIKEKGLIQKQWQYGEVHTNFGKSIQI